MNLKAIITGATGMVGEGVLLECLRNPDVEKVLVINRRPGLRSHPKLLEIIHSDFFNLAPIEPQLAAFLKPTSGQRNVPSYYKFLACLYPVGRALYPGGFCTLQELGRAMVNAATTGYSKQILGVKDVVKLAAMDAASIPSRLKD